MNWVMVVMTRVYFGITVTFSPPFPTEKDCTDTVAIIAEMATEVRKNDQTQYVQARCIPKIWYR